MKGKYKFVFFILLFAAAAFLLIFFLQGSNIAVFNPKGVVAFQERNLIVAAVALMLIVVLPVYILLFMIVWRHRTGAAKAEDLLEREHTPINEFVLWLFPALIVLVLALVTWKSTHELDPSKPLLRQGYEGQALTIQVVALNWKWLFIYPEQNIATVNFVQFPERTPIAFELTADAPMNSFWIPQLGGQMYAMAGMVTKLHLMADEAGDFAGSAAEINGRGFSGMKFVARASSQADFDAWMRRMKESPNTLNLDEYNKLAEPSENNPVAYYSSVQENLYNTIVMKFMPPRRGEPRLPGGAPSTGSAGSPQASSGQTMPEMPGM